MEREVLQDPLLSIGQERRTRHSEQFANKLLVKLALEESVKTS